MRFVPLLSALFLPCFAAAIAVLPQDSSPKELDAINAEPVCVWWHKYTTYLSIGAILTEYNITLEQFMKWNPSYRPSAKTLTIDKHYCVQVKSSSPYPKCEHFYVVQHGDTCSNMDFHSRLEFSHAEFSKLIPGAAIKYNAPSLESSYYVPGSDGPESDGPDSNGPDSNGPESNEPDSDATDSNGPDSDAPDSDASSQLGKRTEPPSPLADGVISTCTRYHQVRPGQTCTSISNAHQINMIDL
ncbi:hypothetical protein CDD82_6855 [Ophiocordyceps australis]|uniref:LysM domain-containing protein n=1 Tax=Ophiocordyceps australis TaxID=1399860 RepID=A0A2C5YTR5_9HYPO|nr:hypothetical protein CDD82_6855 [Ophiocordyceps australis]